MVINDGDGIVSLLLRSWLKMMMVMCGNSGTMVAGPCCGEGGLAGVLEYLVGRLAAMDGRMLSSSNISITDLRDVELSLKGDDEAYRRIVERYQGHVGRLLRKFARGVRTHEELVQDVFVEAYRSLGTYAGKAPLENWLGRITVRVGYRYWKRQKREGQVGHFSLEEWDEIEENGVEQVEPERAGRIVHELLGQLGVRDRLVVTLRYLEGLSVEETADRTGWSCSMVKVQSWRAKKRLGKLFETRGRSIEL